MSDFLSDFKNGEKMKKTPHLRNQSLNLADKYNCFTLKGIKQNWPWITLFLHERRNRWALCWVRWRWISLFYPFWYESWFLKYRLIASSHPKGIGRWTERIGGFRFLTRWWFHVHCSSYFERFGCRLSKAGKFWLSWFRIESDSLRRFLIITFSRGRSFRTSE